MLPINRIIQQLTRSCHRSQVFILLLAMVLGNPGEKVLAETFSEYQVKADFLYNLTNFITWPEEAFIDHDAPFFIGIIGENPFGDLLSKVVEKETVNRHPILLIHYPDDGALAKRPCHMLFISQPNVVDWPRMMKTALSNHMLTVSDISGFVEKGGMINMIKQKGRIRIEINLPATRKADINISAQLLNLAKIHHGDGATEAK